MIFAASIRFFEGRQPRFTQVPPMVRSSIITEVLPSSCARNAAANAVEPEPRITRSKSLLRKHPLLSIVVSLESAQRRSKLRARSSHQTRLEQSQFFTSILSLDG